VSERPPVGRQVIASLIGSSRGNKGSDSRKKIGSLPQVAGQSLAIEFRFRRVLSDFGLCDRLNTTPNPLKAIVDVRTRARLSAAPPTCRMPLGPFQASPKLIPEDGPTFGFDINVTDAALHIRRSHRRATASSGVAPSRVAGSSNILLVAVQ
jgi:hypothetical protein